jgi:DNA mismatch repair protein MutS2
MARRLGLPDEVCQAAEATIPSEAQQLSHAITQLEVARTAFEQEHARARTEREQAATLRSQQQTLLAELEDKRRRLWRDELAEAKTLVRRLHEEGREVLARMRAAQPRARQELGELLQAQRQLIAVKERELQPAPIEPREPPQIGDEVEIREGKIRGELLAIHGDRARIRRGNLTFEAPLNQIRKAVRDKPDPQVRVLVDTATTSAIELNLLGLRVHEALPRLEAFLDHALLEQRSSVRIVHGMGTGALRRAVRDFLSGSRYCASYNEASRAEGGGGVTIAELTI